MSFTCERSTNFEAGLSLSQTSAPKNLLREPCAGSPDGVGATIISGGEGPVKCGRCSKLFLRRPSQIKNHNFWCVRCDRDQKNKHNAEKIGGLTRHQIAYRKRRSYYVAYWKKAAKDPEYIKVRRARRRVWYAIETGKLFRAACEICGNPKTEAHHDDYSRPLEVRWLCRKHHGQLHQKPTVH